MHLRRQQIDQVEFGPCRVMYVLITDRSVWQCALLNIARSACCLVISVGVQRDMVDFAWGGVARSIGVSRYTCTLRCRSDAYRRGNEYVYRYEGHVLSGLPKMSNHYAGLNIRTDVVLQFLPNFNVVAKVRTTAANFVYVYWHNNKTTQSNLGTVRVATMAADPLNCRS